MNKPCKNDNRFIGTAEEMDEAAKLCAGCPLLQACGELGLGELDGVYGGMTPTHPIRKAHRAANDLATRCLNGHRLDLFSWAVDGGSQKPIIACRRCATLARYVAEEDGSSPIPDTRPRKPDMIRNHGTEAGWLAHRRRGETPCGSCQHAKNVANAEYRAAS